MNKQKLRLECLKLVFERHGNADYAVKQAAIMVEFVLKGKVPPTKEGGGK